MSRFENLDQQPVPFDRETAERAIHRAVNNVREAHGRQRLPFDVDLRGIARSHSRSMATEGYFAHESPDGDGVRERYAAHGYNGDPTGGGRVMGENISMMVYGRPVHMDGRRVEFDTPEQLANGVVCSWMNSPGHRRNLLASRWTIEGIGVYRPDEVTVYVTQNFG